MNRRNGLQPAPLEAAVFRPGWLVAVMAVSVSAGVADSVAQEPVLPPFEQVATAVGSYFSSRDDFRAGDLIHASTVAAVLADVAKAGWEVPEGDALVQRALPDSHFLVRTFSERAGREFLRKVAAMPSGYSQLDQLSSMRDGRKHIRYLIRQKDGHLLVKYLTTTRGGKNLGRQMSRVPGRVNLNQPTDRIYTAEQLLAELKTIYEAQAGR